METLRIEHENNGIATVSLNRPAKRNAMSAAMIDELASTGDQLGQDKGVRVVILAGQGKSFCAGADLGWMKSQMEASADERKRQANGLAAMLYTWNSIPKPVIARVHGHVFGGGVGLISVCDAVIAAEGTLFGLTETRLGLIPATISPYVMARIGEAHARRLFMSARIFSVAEAREFALVTKGVPSECLVVEALAEAESYLNSAPGAVADAKALARQMGTPIGRRTIEYTVSQLMTRWESDEAPEGVSAFFEKRNPWWVSGK